MTHTVVEAKTGSARVIECSDTTSWSRLAAVTALALGLVSACASGGTLQQSQIDIRKQLGASVQWMRSSPERIALSRFVYAKALERIETLRREKQLPRKWAVVLDADETVLDNTPYEKWRAEARVDYASHTFADWCRRAAAAAVPGAVEFTAGVKANGGAVAIVSNRTDSVREATEKNLVSLGIRYDEILTLSEGADLDKGARWRAVRESYGPIVLFVGDQVDDFPVPAPLENRPASRSLCSVTDVAIGTKERLNKQPFGVRPEGFDSALGLMGSCFFLLPNPEYGGWQRNEWR